MVSLQQILHASLTQARQHYPYKVHEENTNSSFPAKNTHFWYAHILHVRLDYIANYLFIL